MTFERLVRDEPFASRTVTMVGVLGLKRATAVIVNTRFSEDRTVELLAQACDRAVRDAAVTLIGDPLRHAKPRAGALRQVDPS